MKAFFYICILSVVTLASCSSKYDKSQITGDWQTISWIQLDDNQEVNRKMDFEFKDDNRYHVNYDGSATEEGRYWLAGEFLHTVEDGRAEKKVRITQLTADTMVFEMNRAGHLESVTLIRK